MEKIKILRIITRLNIGGPATHTILLTDGLNKNKFNSILVAGKVSENEGEMLYLANEKEVKPIIIPELNRKINLKNDWIVLWKLYHLIKQEKPDIVHTHMSKAGALGRSAAILYNLTQLKKKAKLVHTFHGHVLEGYFGKFKTAVSIWIERILAKFTDRIIAVSQRIKQDLLNLKVSVPEKITVIPLGLELGDLLKIPLPDSKNSSLKIGIIARLVPIKNHRMFLDVIKKSRPWLKNKVKFFIIGDGQLREKLQAYTRELKIEDEVTLMGWQRDLENVYGNLDIVALTSFNEGTPVSLIEAMAAGRAVIATDVGGVKDLIGNNERGILIKSGDTDEFSQGLRQLLEDTELRNKLAKQGRDFVKEGFSKERLINDIEMLYNNLLKEGLNLCAH